LPTDRWLQGFTQVGHFDLDRRAVVVDADSMPDRITDNQLAFLWHFVDFLAVLSLVGLIWAWRHLTPTTTEIARSRANNHARPTPHR
jgi:hypothetical protein